MSTAIPKEIRKKVQEAIWNKAEMLDWHTLTDIDRAVWYENWSKDQAVGGVLAHFMDARKVRVYIKDSLLKPYFRTRLEANLERIFSVAGIDPKEDARARALSKPHGRILADGRVLCWGRSRDWRSVVVSVFERSRGVEFAVPFAAVLVEMGAVTSREQRKVVCEVGSRLGVRQVHWIA